MNKLLLVGCLFLGGCCTTKFVYVPVETCPKPTQDITFPVLMKDNLPADASTKQKLEAIRLDFGVLQMELKRCIITLDAYR